jgi:hypothetical protein
MARILDLATFSGNDLGEAFACVGTDLHEYESLPWDQ